ncbi:MAG: zinc ABC transporter solute-binding protein, partial [Nanoarchaeota archaeon]|nr:zinc ABC transporter solute-binding protein [Nanoarchaeota archaeon]
GLSPDAEPSPRKVAEIIDIAEQEGINYIFFESVVDPRVSSALEAETGAKALSLSIAETSNGKTFIEAMYDNLETLKIGLECK